MPKGRSATQLASSYVSKLEGGKSQAKIADIRQCMALLKKQHKNAKRGDPSILHQLIKEVGRKRKKRKAKKR